MFNHVILKIQTFSRLQFETRFRLVIFVPLLYCRRTRRNQVLRCGWPRSSTERFRLPKRKTLQLFETQSQHIAICYLHWQFSNPRNARTRRSGLHGTPCGRYHQKDHRQKYLSQRYFSKKNSPIDSNVYNVRRRFAKTQRLRELCQRWNPISFVERVRTTKKTVRV